MGNKRQRFLHKTSPPVQYEHGNSCDDACFQFFADLRVFMSLRHMFPGFSVEIKRRAVFGCSPCVIGEFGHRVVHQPCLTEGCGDAAAAPASLCRPRSAGNSSRERSAQLALSQRHPQPEQETEKSH